MVAEATVVRRRSSRLILALLALGLATLVSGGVWVTRADDLQPFVSAPQDSKGTTVAFLCPVGWELRYPQNSSSDPWHHFSAQSGWLEMRPRERFRGWPMWIRGWLVRPGIHSLIVMATPNKFVGNQGEDMKVKVFGKPGQPRLYSIYHEIASPDKKYRVTISYASTDKSELERDAYRILESLKVSGG